MTRLGRLCVQWRWLVVVATGVFVVVAATAGGGVAAKLTSGGFEDPDSESSRASRLLEREFGVRDPNLVLLVTATDGTVDDGAVAAAGRALTEQLAAEPGVEQVVSYWGSGNAPQLRSDDGRQALVVGVVPGDDDQVEERIEQLSPRYQRDGETVRVGVGGQAEVSRQIDDQLEEDLTRAELIAFPVVLVLLVVVFGSLVAAGLPLLSGAVAIAGTFLALSVLASFTDVSIYALNLTTVLGLGLAIDYSLFVVSRFREELRRGLAPHDAVVRTVETAGRTVLFSALTLAVSLAALLAFPLVFLRSFAYAGIAVSVVVAATTVIFVPGLLAILGRRIDSLALWRRRPAPEGRGLWHRLATLVMGRPILVATTTTAFLLLLGSPFLGIELGEGDDRVLAETASSRVVHDDIRASFTASEHGQLQIVAPDLRDPGAQPPSTRWGPAIDRYSARLSQLPGAARVEGLTGTYVDGRRTDDPGAGHRRFFQDGAGVWWSLTPSVEPLSPAGERLTEQVRGVESLTPTLVTGPSAELVDAKASMVDRLPLAIGLIAAATFVLLFLMFGSLLVPLKAVVLNVLSLSATFGAMVWVFQEGHLSGLLDFTATGTINTTTPVLMFCVAFGLSMDYEVFLLSRIREEHDRTADTTASVATGLERTGRIVTAAAILISVVLLALGTSGVSFLKMLGIGLALAVLMDAFVIRLTLVPAVMRLAGRANWWAPAPLRHLHRRFGINHGVHGIHDVDRR